MGIWRYRASWPFCQRCVGGLVVWGEASHLHRPGVSMQALSADFGVLINLCERNYTPTEHCLPQLV